MRLSTSTKAKVAAAILTAAIPMAGGPAAHAQQVASEQITATSVPTVETAGRIAAEICKKRNLGLHTSDCIGAERDRMMLEIAEQARRTSEQAHQTSAHARAVSAAIDARKPCIEKLKGASNDDRVAAMDTAHVTQITRDNVCDVAAKLPVRKADASAPAPLPH